MRCGYDDIKGAADKGKRQTATANGRRQNKADRGKAKTNAGKKEKKQRVRVRWASIIVVLSMSSWRAGGNGTFNVPLQQLLPGFRIPLARLVQRK